MQPSSEYMALATTLLDSLGDSRMAPDSILLQLQALFGPMLTSALHLVDKRDVVRVSLPHGRYVYQITSSTGKPYTLHLDLPEPPVMDTKDKAPTPPPDGPPDSPTLNPTGVHDIIMDVEPEIEPVKSEEDDIAQNKDKRHQLQKERQVIEKMYCPCPGFAYNSLAGEKNVLCKHLLAALIGWKTGREIKTEVPQYGVVSLLDLQGSVEVKEEIQVKKEGR